MLEAFSRIRNCSLFCYFWCVIAVGFLQAQETKSIQDIEKVYLHTDNSRYFIGENLYYKAYNVNAYNNLLFDNSNILYVELIAPDSEIIARNKTNLEIGLGYGDFKISDSIGIKPGIYQLRAYTNWNRNYGDDFVFKKNIEILDVFESNTNKNVISSKFKKNFPIAINNSNTVTINFFPEGGSLIENVASVVGFKAVDNAGNPIEVKGEIFDSDDQLVTAFSSVHDGMGKFQMIPISGKQYYAKTKSASGGERRDELPKVLEKGYVLIFRTFKGRNIISILTNEASLLQNPNAVFTVECKAKGISYFETTPKLTQTTVSFELDKNSSPEGISQITLYDSNSIPQSERLVYIEKDQDLDVRLATDKLIYKPNEKATVTISSKSKVGEAKSGSFSLSVTDMNGITEDKDYGTTISSYFLMESDIRGKVNQPSYYFDVTNLKRLEHLDNLLLTQGWRDFVWKKTVNLNANQKYVVEKGFTISGRVKQVFSNNPKVNNKMSLTLSNKKHMNFFSTLTDAKGCFKYENLMFSGKTNLYLNTRNEKGKFKGEIVLDSIDNPPLFVSFKSEPISRTGTTKMVYDNVYHKYTAFGVKPENILDEVQVTAKKKKMAIVPYGAPDYSYTINKTEAKKKRNISELIEEQCFGVIPPNFEMEMQSYFGDTILSSKPIILVDGYEAYDAEEVLGISPEDVVKIEVVSGYVVNALYDRSQVISIFTNGNRSKVVGSLQSIKLQIEGYHIERVFYSPTAEQIEAGLDNMVAVRNTLYWNPFVHPDKMGDTSLSYYNTKVETKVKVALEGITSAGIPVVKNTYYTIKK